MNAAGENAASEGAPSPEAVPVRDAVSAYLSSPSRIASRLRRQMLRYPPAEVIAELAAALERRDTGAVAARRAAAALAKIGGPDGLAPLASLLGDPLPRAWIAVRALGRAGTDECMDVLIEALPSATRGGRRAIAEALAARRVGRAVGAICRNLTYRNGRVDPFMLRALRKYGRPAAMVEAVLSDAQMDGAQRVAALLSLTDEAQVIGRAQVQRHLERVAERGAPALQPAAREAARLFSERTTLLRPAEKLGDETLLRPASGRPSRDTSTLLTPAQEEPARIETVDRGRPSLMSRILDALKDAFQPD